MKRELGDIIRKSAANVSLTESERERMERVVTGYVGMKPIRNGSSRVTPRVHWYLWVRQPLAAGLVLALVLSGTGVSFAAEGAVPGDLLYPVKVSVNEEVRASLAFSNEERGQWEAKRAERRLEEAATLAVSGKLDTETKTELAERFDKHSERAVQSAESFEEGDVLLALNLASDFETRLKAHEELLEEVDDDDKRIIDKVRNKLERTISLRQRAEGRLAFAHSARSKGAASAPVEMALFMSEEAGEEPAADGRMFDEDEPSEEQSKAVAYMRELALESNKKARDSFDATASELDEERKTRAEESLVVSLQLIAEGDAALNSGESLVALDHFRESVAVSNRLTVFLKASEGLEIKRIPDVRFYEWQDRDESGKESDTDDLEDEVSVEGEFLRRIDLGL